MRKNLRVLMIAPTTFFSSRGGHLRILGEAIALKRLGYSITLCTYGVGNDVSSVRILRGKLKPKNLRQGPSKVRALLDIDLLVTSIKICVRERPDIVHCHLHEGAAIGEILSIFSGAPTVLDVQGSISEETLVAGLARRGSVLHFLLRVFEILTIRKAHVILLSSNQLVETYRSLLPPDKQPKLKVVLDGFDNSHFKPLPKNHELQRKLRIPENKKVIVYLGSLERQQGITTMIETARLVLSQRSDVHFLFMGTPVDMTLDECKAIAAQNMVSKETTFLGTVPYETAPEYLSLGDIAISGKVSKTESNGKICVYMAMGLPTVCFDTPVNRDLLGNLGFFAEGPTPNSLAEQVFGALDSLENRGDALRTQLAKRANDVASWSSMASQISESYGQIASEGTVD